MIWSCDTWLTGGSLIRLFRAAAQNLCRGREGNHRQPLAFQDLTTAFLAIDEGKHSLEIRSSRTQRGNGS